MGLQSHIRLTSKRDLDMLNSPEFEEFRQVFDGELKRITNTGLGQKQKQTEPIRDDEEHQLWKLKLLGGHNARVLVNTMVYLNGKDFSLRSGSEHRSLRYKSSQITLCEPTGKRAYLKYKEDISKTCQGGLKHRKITPKGVTHHASECKERCHVMLYKKYMSLCPTDGRDDMFYLTPLQHPTDTCWYSRQPIGHNTLQKVVPELCRKEGVRTYKRTSEDQKEAISSILNGTEDQTEDASDVCNTTAQETVLPPASSGAIIATNCVIHVLVKK
ncbi:transcriptional regulator QRICH1-like [Haliotis asinina]|uniref:transcriptional regulator QRICH1-like n=1 Tax=Haliotis asinina TaxID=109174 RepID=UPI003531D4F4